MRDGLQGFIRLNIDGHYLNGFKRNGVWKWQCSTLPELCRKHQNCTEPKDMVKDYLDLALRLARWHPDYTPPEVVAAG